MYENCYRAVIGVAVLAIAVPSSIVRGVSVVPIFSSPGEMSDSALDFFTYGTERGLLNSLTIHLSALSAWFWTWQHTSREYRLHRVPKALKIAYAYSQVSVHVYDTSIRPMKAVIADIEYAV